MASYTNYRTEDRKKKKEYDIYKKRKNFNKSNENRSKSEKLREGFKKWTSFFRANPHRFAEEYLGLKLKLFQKILLYMMFHVNMFAYFAARGQGKSFLIAIFCIIRCILWPSTKIVVASGTKGQAKLIITEKIEKELMQHPNIAREIKDIRTSNNDIKVIFHNGSTIEAVTSNDHARGYRAQILVLDEFRLINEGVYKQVLRPFLTAVRQPPYLSKPEYKHMVEENKEIFITSAYYKNNWSYVRFRVFLKNMLQGRSYFTVGLPYTLSLHHGLLTEERVRLMREEDDMDEITWLMEMDCIFWGESEKAFFNLNDIQKCRKLVKPFYPKSNLEFIDDKKISKSNISKKPGEIRLIGVDVALMGGQENDNTIFTLVRLLPNGEKYIRQVVYIESLNGSRSDKQAIKTKRLFYDFNADYVAMDAQGNGMSLYEDLSTITYDEERDVEYPAWKSMNDDEMAKRADNNALPVIYTFKVVGGNREINHNIAMNLRDDFKKGNIELLVNEIEGRDYLIDRMDYTQATAYDQAHLELPYLQTTALVNELVNLEYEMSGGFVKIKEVGSARKDRYSSLGYANYLADILEEDLRKGSDEYDFGFFFN